MVLQVGERANAPGELNEEAPCGNWQMDDRDPSPPHRDRCAQQGEKDEHQMDYQDSVSGQTVEHVRAGMMVEAYSKCKALRAIAQTDLTAGSGIIPFSPINIVSRSAQSADLREAG